MPKTVVVLGGSMGGLSIVHRLLKYTWQKDKDLKVILVSKNDHLYWNIASVRAVVQGTVKDEDILVPIAPGLAQYPQSSYEFVHGSATGIDEVGKQCVVALHHNDEERVIPYDYLVVSTGARAIDATMPWKSQESSEECLRLLHEVRDKVTGAKHIIIAGAGPTGVELAGEIRSEFRDKDVLLLCADQALVHGDSAASAMERELIRLGVVIRKGVRGRDVEVLPSGQTLVTLSNDEKLVTDLCLPTSGQKPNSDFMPETWVTSRKYANVDECLRIKDTENVWAIGDVISKPRADFLLTDQQAGGVVKNIELVMKGYPQQRVRGMFLEAFICSIGRHRGAGRIGHIPAPSWLVYMLKGKTLGLERAPKYVDGSFW